MTLFAAAVLPIVGFILYCMLRDLYVVIVEHGYFMVAVFAVALVAVTIAVSGILEVL